MKKTLSIGATLLASAVALFAAQTAVRADKSQNATSENSGVEAKTIPVENASFEDADSDGFAKDWRPVPNVFRVEKGVARTGESSLRWDLDDPKEYPLSGQRLKEFRPGANFEFSVWVKTENVAGTGGATACVEWNGPDGKWAGGAYANAVRGTTLEWTRVVGRGVIPEDATSLTATCYVREGGTGTAWFDDFEIKTITPPFLSGIASNRYRQIVAGGELTIRVGVETKYLNGEIKELNAPIVLSGESLETSLEFAPKTFGSDFVEFVLPVDDLAPGKYVATYSTANPKDGSEESLSIVIKRVAEFPKFRTYIDEHKRAIVDGKPFFPLGLYFSSVKTDEMKIFADSAFNCLMPYSAISREQLDLCAANGIGVIYSVKDNYPSLAVKTVEDGIEKTTRKVAEMKDHPAIIAWYINDELPLSVVDQLTARRDLMEELDPSRPTWAVLYQIDEIRGYISTCDVLGTDPYPVPEKPLSTVADYSFRTNAAAFQTQAVWQVPQIFNWAAYKKDDEKNKFRAPTFDEMRYFAWASVAGGANGLVFYSWFDLWKMDKTVENGGSALVREPFDERWPEVKAVAAEVAEYFPVLLSVGTPFAVEKSGSTAVASRLYSFEGKTWALIVNTTEEMKSATLTASEASRVELKLGGKIVAQNGGTVDVELAPLEPAFVVFSK